MPEPTPQTWLEKQWKAWRSVLGFVVVLLILGDIKGCIFPDHPAPVSLEADGKSYVACNTPDISRGLFHLSSTYSVDFEDNNGSTISLRGVEKLIVTNLPKEVDAPMPSPDTDNMADKDSDGKPLVDGNIYNWDDGTEARWKGGKWLPVKIKNRVCESDDSRHKRLAQEEERRQAHQKRAAEVDAAKLAQTCKEWEQKHPLGSPVDAVGSPEGCEGPLETAYKEKMEQEQASLAKEYAAQAAAAKQNTKNRTTSVSTHHGATVANAYGAEIYERCYFNAGDLPCGYDNGRWGKIASLHRGERVQLLSAKIRSSGGSDIYEVKFQQWTGWMDATSLNLDVE